MTTYFISQQQNIRQQIQKQIALLGQSTRDAALNTGVRILSINNSLIGTVTTSSPTGQSLPTYFSSFLQGTGKAMTWDDVTSFETTLLDHYNINVSFSRSARRFIRARPYSHIILQDLSTHPVSNVSSFYRNIRLFKQEIDNYNPGAKILLWQNWPLSDSTNYAADIVTIENSYRTIAWEIGADIIPCGRAWNAIRQSPGFPTIPLYKTGDNRHPTIQGIHLNAACLYSTIFKSTPTVSTFLPSSISSTDIATINSTAWANIWEPYTALTISGTDLTTSTGRNLGNISRLEIYISNINWNNGAGTVTLLNNRAEPSSGAFRTTIPLNCIYVYQTGETENQMRVLDSLNPANPNIYNLDNTKQTYIAIVDTNYGNNSGSFVANVKTYG